MLEQVGGHRGREQGRRHRDPRRGDDGRSPGGRVSTAGGITRGLKATLGERPAGVARSSRRRPTSWGRDARQVLRHHPARGRPAAVELGAWAIGLIFWAGLQRACDPGRGRHRRRAAPRGRARRRVRQLDPRRDRGAAEAFRCRSSSCTATRSPRSAARSPGAPAPGSSRPRRITTPRLARPRALPHRLPPARRAGARDARRHRRDVELGPRRAAAAQGAADPSGGLTAENVEEGIAAVAPFAVNVATGVESSPGSRTPRWWPRSWPPRLSRVTGRPVGARPRRGASRRRAACARQNDRRSSRASLRPVRRALRARDADAGARRAPGRVVAARADAGTGRSWPCSSATSRPPSPLYHAEQLSASGRPRGVAQARGSEHTGSHKFNNALGQACWPGRWASRGSSPRPAPASTGSPPRPPARCSGWSTSSTWAARTCAARCPTSSGYQLLGATVSGVEAGSRTLKEAVSAAIRRLASERRPHPLRDRLVRRPGAVPRARARPAADHGTRSATTSSRSSARRRTTRSGVRRSRRWPRRPTRSTAASGRAPLHPRVDLIAQAPSSSRASAAAPRRRWRSSPAARPPPRQLLRLLGVVGRGDHEQLALGRGRPAPDPPRRWRGSR